jgi:hypothetical protein
LINTDQLTGLLDRRRFFETPLNGGFLRRRADQRVENASEDEGAQLIDGKGRTDTHGSGCGKNAVLCDLGFNVLRQSGLADANRAANRLATGAGAARDLVEKSIGVSGAPDEERHWIARAGLERLLKEGAFAQVEEPPGVACGLSIHVVSRVASFVQPMQNSCTKDSLVHE